MGIVWPSPKIKEILDKVVANQTRLEELRLQLRGLHMTSKDTREKRRASIIEEMSQLELGMQDLHDELQKNPMKAEDFIPPSHRGGEDEGGKPPEEPEKVPAPGTGDAGGFLLS